jgi:hypothetical protein
MEGAQGVYAPWPAKGRAPFPPILGSPRTGVQGAYPS